MNKKTILVNGMLYDAVTGMPLGKQADSRASTAPENRQAKAAYQMHRRTDESHVLQRHVKPEPLIQKRSTPQRVINPVSKSPEVSRFAPRPVAERSITRSMNDIRPATMHPVARRAEARMQQHAQLSQPQTAPFKPSSLIKQEAIDDALSKATPNKSAGKKEKHTNRTPKLVSFASMALALLLLAGYLTYINLPNISVRVAANQAGINASYPGYRPDGYRLAGVNYDKGSVSLKFAANAGPHDYTITQQQTSWDSSAVKENYVKTKWGDDVVPYSERGLTIYAHDGNAAWVNGGILYTITGDTKLSASQVRSIATSM